MVPVILEGGAGISAIELTLGLDSRLTLPAEDFWIAGSLLPDHTLGFERRNGSARILVSSASSSEFGADRGTLLQLRVNLQAGIPNGVQIPVPVVKRPGF